MSAHIVDNNDEAIEAWNTVLFDKFVQYRKYVSQALALHGDRALDKLAPAPGSKIVDIGCGFGDTTLQLSDRVGPTGLAVGIDAAPRFIELARSEAGDRANIRYDVADVESSVPGGPYDHAFSRMGTMFFARPVIALRNIRKALVPGGTLCMVVWRKKEANEGFYKAEMLVRDVVGDPPKNDAVTCGPGPFSMASADMTSDQLIAAGFTNIAFTRSDGEILTGDTPDIALGFALNVGPAGEVMRLAGEVGYQRRGEIETALRGMIGQQTRPDGRVYAPTSTWIVTAQNPA